MISAVRPLQDLPQPLLDEDLGAGVHRGGRLIEDQDRRVGEDGARERDELPLAGRERGPSLADLGVESVRERSMKSRARATAAARPDRVVGGVEATVADVLGDGAGEQERLLQDDPEVAAKRAHRACRARRSRRRSTRPSVAS